MPSFPKPKFDYDLDLAREQKAVNKHLKTRKVPDKSDDTLLLATWNIANLGEQKREKVHYKLLAHIAKQFDLIAVQEVKENLDGLMSIMAQLPSYYKTIFNDAAGNNERMAFIYDSRKISHQEEIGEVAVPPSDLRHIKLPGVSAKFDGFDRNPFLASFLCGNFSFSLINVHLYYGDDTDAKSIGRRCLEVFAVARYADLRNKSAYAFTPMTLALGDFNLPKRDDDDPVYQALTARGLTLPDHTSLVYSNLNDDEQYDQIAFFPSFKNQILNSGVFDFDNVVFADLYDKSKPAKFRGYVKYYVSDHRPLWMQVKIS